MIAIDLGEQKELDAVLKIIQQINFTKNTKMFFVFEKSKETLNFSEVTVKVLSASCNLATACTTILFCFNITLLQKLIETYNSLNIKFSNSQLNKSCLRIKSGIQVASSFSSNVVDKSNDESSFPHILCFINVFANGSSAKYNFQQHNCLRRGSKVDFLNQQFHIVYMIHFYQ